MDDSERPHKRIKTTDNFNATSQCQENGTAEFSKQLQGLKGWSRSVPKTGKPGRPQKSTLFAHTSVISAGDKGIYVTSDKGREKKAVLEFHDLLEYHLGGSNSNNVRPTDPDASEQQPGIENDIESELASMRGDNVTTETDEPQNSLRWQLIMLDIPCVSFVRFAPSTNFDPTTIVHEICNNAASPTSTQPRSRAVRRLTPITTLAKTLSQGLERICDEVLPQFFGVKDGQGEIESTTFAIKPTIRNNDKMKRNEVIELVAGKVQEFGQGKHKVDLKGYEKGVLVEVYRNWVGMNVVENRVVEGRIGYEGLKRFNLAEIQVQAMASGGNSIERS
ncbi:hypothetical protein LTR66_016220 [Elasticomyces elasticus]|nr:hypothetical protein LTR66_016220 [Elasticomyces elasticus]